MNTQKWEIMGRYRRMLRASGGRSADRTTIYHGEKANACLIAAAPDLLAACKAALARLDRLYDDGTGEHSPAYLQVKAAIAKAEGRAQ